MFGLRLVVLLWPIEVNEPLGLLRRNRFAEEEALNLVARLRAQEIGRLLRLHSFAHDLEVQRLRHSQCGGGQWTIVQTVVGEERAIELEAVDGKPPQIAKR